MSRRERLVKQGETRQQTDGRKEEPGTAAVGRTERHQENLGGSQRVGPLPLRGHVLFQLPKGQRPFGCPTSDPPERTPQLTHQGNPVGVERAESHLGDELGAGEKQEVEVEEVFELIKQHLQWRQETLEAGGFGVRQTRDLSNTPPEHNSRGTCTVHLALCHLLFRKTHLGDENTMGQSKNTNDTRGNSKHQIQDSGDFWVWGP